MKNMVSVAALMSLVFSGAALALDAQNSDDVLPNSPQKPDSGEFNPVPGPMPPPLPPVMAPPPAPMPAPAPVMAPPPPPPPVEPPPPPRAPRADRN